MLKPLVLLAAVVCTALAAPADPEGVVNGWDFRSFKNISFFGKDQTVTVKVNAPGKIQPNCFRSIPCRAGAKVKLKITIMGEGSFNMGCHAYDGKNMWVTNVRGKAVDLLPGRMETFEFNVTIPASEKGEIKAIRPFMDFAGGSDLVFRKFEHTVQEPEQPENEQAVGGIFPPFFERLRLQPGDFPVRVLPSLQRVALDFVERPFIDNAMDIKSLKVCFVENETNIVVAEKCYIFHNCTIQDEFMALPGKLDGAYLYCG